MPITLLYTPLRVDPRSVTEHTGLKVPAEYDCANVFKSELIWREPEMIRILGYDYNQTDNTVLMIITILFPRLGTLATIMKV
jgi:hypothetical protein